MDTNQGAIEREKLVNAKNKINTYVFWSLGAGLIPVPIVDLIALSGIQVKMISELSKLYGLPFSKNIVKSLIGALLGSSLPVQVSLPLSSLLKTIPVIGQTTGAVTMPVMGGASTYAVGKVFLQHFASGGTFLDFNPEKVRDFYAEQFKEGQKVASDLNQNVSNEG